MVKVSDIRLVDSYPWPVVKGEGKPDRRNVIGWDLESYMGAATILATSEGKSAAVKDLKEVSAFFKKNIRRYNQTLNFFFNLDHDASAILKHLPYDVIDRIRDSNRAYHRGVLYEFLPRKKFTMTFNASGRKLKLTFWDIFQFYQIGDLENTHAKIFPDKPYVKRMSAKGGIRYEDIRPEHMLYCLEDARACQELSQHFVSMVRQTFNLRSYYSAASLGKALMRKNLWADSYRYRPSYVNDAGLTSYSGARIECMVRGYIGENNRMGQYDHAYMMDISSAYPWAMTQLWDMDGIVSTVPKYIPEAKHSFFRVDVRVPEDAHIGPLSVLFKHQRVYPVGWLRDIPLCKAELECLYRHGFKTIINKAAHIIARERTHPFDYMRGVYAERMRLKACDNPLQIPLKTALNASYGSLIQTVAYRTETADPGDYLKEDYGGPIRFNGNRVMMDLPGTVRYRAGAYFHPVWAAETTALVRCKIYDDSIRDAEHILFYATDCIGSDKKLRLDYSPGLGNYECKGPYEGLILGCGLYTLRPPDSGDLSKYKMGGRGFGRGLNLYPLVREHRDKSVYEMLRSGPKKLKETRKKPEQFNVFREDLGLVDTRSLCVNFDMKRIWEASPSNFGELAAAPITSRPHPITALAVRERPQRATYISRMTENLGDLVDYSAYYDRSLSVRENTEVLANLVSEAVRS